MQGYSKQALLGKGAYGSVYKATSPGGTTSAVKCSYKYSLYDFYGNIRELDINYTLGVHPYIISLHSIIEGDPFVQPSSPITERGMTRDHISFVQTLGQCDLKRYIKTSKPDFTTAKRFIAQILLSVEYIHGRGYIHRDLKPDNILVVSESGEETCQVGDFGLSKPFSLNMEHTPNVVTTWFRSPEICLGSSYTQVADMWSVGCIFFNMLTGYSLIEVITEDNVKLVNEMIGKLPYKVSENDLAELNRAYRGRVFNIPVKPKTFLSFLRMKSSFTHTVDECGGYTNFKSLLLGMLAFNPRDRWTASKALDNPFFDDMREWIEATRKSYPPKPRPTSAYTITPVVERKWFLRLVLNVYNMKKRSSWYSHRILFHSIQLMDIALTSGNMYADTSVVPNESIGTILTKERTEIYYFTCLYFCVKYFNTLNTACSIVSVTDGAISTDVQKEISRNFEELIVKDILMYQVYRPSVYDVACNHEEMTEDSTYSLLVFVVNGHHNKRTPEDAYAFWSKHRSHYCRK